MLRFASLKPSQHRRKRQILQSLLRFLCTGSAVMALVALYAAADGIAQMYNVTTIVAATQAASSVRLGSIHRSWFVKEAILALLFVVLFIGARREIRAAEEQAEAQRQLDRTVAKV